MWLLIMTMKAQKYTHTHILRTIHKKEMNTQIVIVFILGVIDEVSSEKENYFDKENRP